MPLRGTNAQTGRRHTYTSSGVEGGERAGPQYANYWAPLMRKRHIPPHPAQPQHTNHRARRTRKHQQEHRPQRPTERSDPTQHAKGRTGDCPGPRKGATTRRNVTQGEGATEGRAEGGKCGFSICLRLQCRSGPHAHTPLPRSPWRGPCAPSQGRRDCGWSPGPAMRHAGGGHRSAWGCPERGGPLPGELWDGAVAPWRAVGRCVPGASGIRAGDHFIALKTMPADQNFNRMSRKQSAALKNGGGHSMSDPVGGDTRFGGGGGCAEVARARPCGGHAAHGAAAHGGAGRARGGQPGQNGGDVQGARGGSRAHAPAAPSGFGRPEAGARDGARESPPPPSHGTYTGIGEAMKAVGQARLELSGVSTPDHLWPFPR